ncbi:PILR alpha-associated neural protein [Dendropsophus ebraccatus]|uniref:PILR alpha-associated neural protein n=1 Tax=Dendropsophus ebraccatus TaxID=150705 RepID=UPI003831EC39
MKWSGCPSTFFIYYSILLSSSCSSFPSLLHPSRSPLRPSSIPNLHFSAPQPSGSSHHLDLHASSPMTGSKDFAPQITYYGHRAPQHLHQRPAPSRGRRQSPASSLLFPSAIEGAAPPSQYPWAILWDPTVSDEEGALSSSTPRPFYHPEWGHLENNEPARGLDLRGIPTTLRPHGFPPKDEGTDPQLYVTIVISVVIVFVATGIIIKFCCERRQKRRRHRNDRCALPEEGSLQPLTDLSPDTDIPGLHPLKLGDFKTSLDERSIPCRTSKIPVVTM